MSVTRYLSAVSVCFGLATLMGCAQVKPTQGTIQQVGTKNDDFEIILRPGWKREDSTELYGWENGVDGQEIVISVLRSEKPMDAELRSTTAKGLMDIRVNSIKDISGGKANLSNIEPTETADGVELAVRGVDPANGIQIYTAVVVHQRRAVSLSFYKYPPLMTDEAFRETSNAVRSALKVY